MKRIEVMKLLQANLLKAKMVAAKMTQADLAEKIGMSKNALSYKMRGHRSFDIQEVDRICDVLNISDPTEKASVFLG